MPMPVFEVNLCQSRAIPLADPPDSPCPTHPHQPPTSPNPTPRHTTLHLSRFSTITPPPPRSNNSNAPDSRNSRNTNRCKVQQLAFCPQRRGLLASADSLGRVLLWQPGRTQPLPEGLASRPELLFVHAGHVLPVEDFSWSTAMYGVLASTAWVLDKAVVAGAAELVAEAEAGGGGEVGAGGLQGQAPGVQVWRPAEDVLPRL